MMKTLIIEYDKESDGTPFIATDDADNSFIRIDKNNPNPFSVTCNVCREEIVSGWESFDGDGGYCDKHVIIKGGE